jgi:hypothetical protein
LEDGPGDFGVAGAELGEAREGRVGGEGDGKGVLLRDGEFGEDGAVGLGDLAEERGGVDVLRELERVGARDGGVGCDGGGEFLGWGLLDMRGLLGEGRECAPSGMLMTTQPLENAVAIACRRSMLFPVPRAPLITVTSVFFAAAASSIFFASLTDSSRTRMLGDLNISQACVILNASTALN